jgi:hypothetical protein
MKQRVVLPHAEPEGDEERGQRDNQPAAQLLQMIDDRQPIVMLYVPDGDGHDL